MTLAFNDTFTRVESSGLGVSDSGHAWTADASWSVDGDRGLVSLAAVNSPEHAVLDLVDEADIDQTVTFVLQGNPQGDALLLSLVGRWSDATTYTGATVSLNPDGTTSVALKEGATTVATTSVDDWAGSFSVHIHFRMVGTACRIKVWYGDAEEPINWDLSTTHTSTNASGSLGVRTSLGAAATNALPYSVYIDDAVFATATTGANVFDAFGRSEASLGTSDSDHVWTHVSGITATTDGDEAVFSCDASNAVQLSLIPYVATDLRTEYDVRLSGTPAQAVNLGSVVRWTDANNYMWFWLSFSSTNTLSLNIRKVVGGVLTAIGSHDLGSITAGTQYSVIGEILGSTVRAMAWVTSGSKPANWQIEIQDTDLPEAGTNVGFRQNSAGTATSYVDNYSLRDVAPGISVELVDVADSPGVRVTISNGDVYNSIRVSRIHVGNEFPETAVRGFDGVVVPSAVSSATDYEAPLDETFVYQVTTLDEDDSVISSNLSDPVVIEVPYHRVILKSVGQPTFSRRIQISEFPSVSQELRVLQTARVLGRSRPVVLFDVLEGMTGSFSFLPLLESDPTGDEILTLLSEGQPLLFQSVSRVTGIQDFYCVIRRVERIPKSTVHPTERRRMLFKVEFEEVQRPPTDAEVLGFFSWQTLIDVNHVDWSSVNDTFASWLSVLNFAGRDPL